MAYKFFFAKNFQLYEFPNSKIWVNAEYFVDNSCVAEKY